MKRSFAILGILLCSLSSASLLRQERREFGSYKEMREYLGELFKEKRYAEASALLERVLDRFPENVLANTYNLATARLFLGDPDKAIQALEEGHRRGIFYGIWDFAAKMWEPVKNSPRFDAFLKENQARIEEAQKKAFLEVEAAMPAGFDPAKKYPLFIALHGGGESTADFKPSWTSPRLRGEFITAYVQSSQVANMKGFHWQDVAITRRDLEAAYTRILKQYPVDTGRVIIGGFSSGGFGSLIAALKNFFPVRGFIVLCPEVPTTISDEDILAAKARGLRGMLLTTEADNRVEQQRALMSRLEKSGLAVDFHLMPSIGHWYPEDFESRLDRALGFVLETEKTDGADESARVSIFEAAERGDLEAVTRLLKADPKLVKAQNAEGDTALHLAAGCRRGEEAALPIVRLLLESGAALETRNTSNQTPLLYAAYGGFRRVIELFIAKGAAVQYQDTNGRSPLHYAAREGRPEAVGVLLKNGANPSLRDNQNRTPLEYAVLGNKTAVVETLMNLVRYDVKGPEGSTLLHAAASQGNDDLVGKLLEQGADPNRPGPNGDSILLSYLRGGLAARAMESIAEGADVNAKDATGRTALHLAAEKGLDEAVSALLDKGADPNAVDRNGLTAFDIARNWGFQSLAALLTAKGGRATQPKVHVLKGGSFEIAELQADAKTESAVIRYIGTDGFLIEAGSKTVLVDGLVSNPWGYTNTPERALALMKADQPPFRGIDLLLFSHAHRDHFEPNMALDVLASQTQAVLVGDSLVTGELLDARQDAYKAFSSRVKTMGTKMGERTDLTVNGIPLTVLGVNHGAADRPYLTLGYIMQLGEFKIYHQGDIFPDANLPFLASIAWEKEKIDIAFFDPFFFQNEETKRIVLERIRPSAVILMHMRDDEVEHFIGQTRRAVPQVLAFQGPMESKVFVKPGR
jgi:ankyrin repeat protein/L-ascorbate metabolism protein UlaG (beta-lactamase superfamily)/predicted esterase